MGRKRSSTKKDLDIKLGDKIFLSALLSVAAGAILFLVYMATVSYFPFYSVGECVQKTEKAEEHWQKDETDILQIIEIGNSNYRVIWIRSDDYPSLVGEKTERPFGTLQSLYSSVKCPEKSLSDSEIEQLVKEFTSEK